MTIHESPDRSDLVVSYFNAVQAGKTTTADGTPVAKLRPIVEKVIQQQVRDVITELGIDNPVGNFLGIHFPPFSFILATPPDLLVTSPLNKIDVLSEVRLKPDLTLSEKETIESQTDQLGVSSLVVGLGGIATVPPLIDSGSSLQYVLDTAAHEWMHQYLAFKPLGFRYVLDLLGVKPDYNIVTINETVASIFGDEVGAMVYNKYYSAYQTPPPPPPSQPVFDFNAAMRNIRLNVDSMLAEGEVTQAEQYMDNQRDFLQTKGYYIRKLNQAYFAFYGTYAAAPTSVSPIGAKIKAIRSESVSIGAFINTMSGITSVKELDELK